MKRMLTAVAMASFLQGCSTLQYLTMTQEMVDYLQDKDVLRITQEDG